MSTSRPQKKAKTEERVHPIASTSKREGLFAPFRSLGHVSTSVPFVYQSKSSKFLETPALTIVTSLGRSWAMWDGASLKLLFVGPDMGAPITALALSMDSVFASAGNFVGRYVRGKEVGRMIVALPKENDSSDEDSDMDSDDEEDSTPQIENLTNLIIFGTTLVALSHSGRKMFIWDIPPYVKSASNPNSTGNITTTPYATIEFGPDFIATKVIHPATYLNKVVVASKDGSLAVWNIRSGALIHTFQNTELLPTPSSITALSQSPAIDVLGVGFASGQCVLFDVRLGEVLGKVRLEGEGSGEVTGVAFRNDDISQTLAISSSSGHVALFDLAAKLRLLHLVRSAHEGPVGGIEWLQGQPLMMTSGGDNSIKQWLFDSPTAAPRLLKQRSGHHAPPHLIRYYGEDGKGLLTAGADRALRYTSVVRDSRGYELSQGSIARKANNLGVAPSTLKLPVINSIAYSTSRSKDWDDVVTTHEGESRGRTWSVEGKRVGKFTMVADATVQTTAVTACGNFGLVGSSGGEVVLYNMQSGMKRKVFKVPSGGAGDTKGRQITGISTDALNRVVIISTLRGGIHFFDFQTMKHVESMTISAPITAILLQRDNGLLAITCDDLTVRIVDIETRRVVRELTGFKGAVLDIAFSADSRWVMTTSQDSIIRTFDVPTGQLVDAFKTSSIATSLTFSPTFDFLATAHVDSVGVYLWANRNQFSEVPLRTFIEEDLGEVELPTVQGLDAHETLSSLAAPRRWEDIQPYTTPDQLSEDLLTLSLMPRSRWQTLLNLETIKLRNKPKEAPKAPERAPFFLPTLPGTEQRFDFGAVITKGPDPQTTRRLDMSSANVETDFVRRLYKEEKDGDYQSFFEYLKALSPSAVDLEIRSLSSLIHLSSFLAAISARLISHKDFEAVQTFLACFLRIHGDILIQNVELKVEMKKVSIAQKLETERLMNLTHYAIGTLAFLRSAPIV